MKFSQSGKFWLIFLLILVAAFLGGILGNWVFIYLLDKYYGIPGGNYLAAPTSSTIVVRDAKTIAEQDSRITQAIAAADASFIRIFKKTSAVNEIYEPEKAVLSGFVVTSDGWFVVPGQLPVAEDGSFDQYEAVSVDRKRFEIEKTFYDPILDVSFIYLSHAQNLVVRNFVFKGELSIGQTLIGSVPDGSIEIGRLSRPQAAPKSSDNPVIELPVNGFTMQPAYLFDVAGQMVGLNQGNRFLAMDSIGRALENVLTNTSVTYPRLGVHYFKLSELMARGTEAGALLSDLDKNNPAVVPGSPANKAGLLVDDIITAVDDSVINGLNDLASIIQEYDPGDTIVITIRRGQETKTLSVTLDEFINK